MEKLDREDGFYDENAADFPAASPVAVLTAQIKPKMAQALALDAQLATESGERRAAQEAKSAARDALVALLEDGSTAAVGIGSSAPGIAAQFRVPRDRTDQNLIAAATAFASDAAAHETEFVNIGLDADFRTQLTDLRDQFITARDDWNTEVAEYGGAAHALDELFREMMALSRQRSAAVQIRYKNNPQKLGAWTIASHLERAPKKKDGGKNGGGTPGGGVHNP